MSGHGSGGHGTAQKLVGSGSTTLADAIASQNHNSSSAAHAAHGSHTGMVMEHASLLDLFPDASDAGTSVAINGGSWFDPNTWADGKVPGNGQSVYIPEGIVVIYDGESNARLETVGVSGELHFAVDTDSKMVVDTLVTAPTSVLTVGSKERPVQTDVSVEIIIADNGAIDLSDDPTQLGRGVVTHGQVEVHGASKAPYLKLATEPEAGDTTLTLEGDVGSWQVGDSLVVMGTKYVGQDSNGILRTQDEEVTIIAIDEATGVVTIDRPLVYDHTTPDYVGRAGIDNELSVYVGNSSRNVTFSSENPEGVRGHVMFMHNPDVDVRFAEFNELGRTDKSKPINTNELWDENDWDDRGPGIRNGPGADVIGTARNPGTDNVEGRYALHIHRTGAEADAKLAILEGNSVTGSPGWGIVHHDSHAAIDYNFVYGVSGAGIVSEDANETGQWIGNFVTSTVGTGRDVNVLTLEKNGDFGIDGIAYESQARQILQQNNIAANSNTAWMFNTSETSTQGPSVDVIQFDPSGNPFKEKERFDEEDTSIIGFDGNQIIAVDVGIFTGHRNIDNATDIQQTFSNLTAYNVESEAVHIFNYTNEYVFKDNLFVNIGRAFKVGDKAEGINLSNVHIEDAFEVFESRGYNANGVFTDLTYQDVNRTLSGYDLNDNRVNLENTILNSANLTPVDKITFRAASGTEMTLRPDGGELDIRGTLTDSVGDFEFRANNWIRQAVHTFEGLQTRVSGGDMDYILEKYGAIKNADGSWDLGFYWWAGDRLTGENQAVFIPIRLEGFNDSDLEPYRISEFTPPSNEVTRYYDGGIQSIDQDFQDSNSHGASNPPHDSGVRKETQTLNDGRVVETTYIDGKVREITSRDQGDTGNWESFTDTFDADGQRETRTVFYDNGQVADIDFGADGIRETQTTTDADDTLSWSERFVTFADDGRQTADKILTYDDGRVSDFDFAPDGKITGSKTTDAADAYSWDERDVTFGSDGKRTDLILTYDDGRIADFDFRSNGSVSSVTTTDADDAYLWTERAAKFAADGQRKTDLVFTYDDGRVLDYDYDAAGNVTQRTMTDEADNYAWSSYTQSYDSNGNITHAVFVYDVPIS